NEPPLVPYRFPIIGHTYDFVHDSENFLKECKEKHPEVLRHSDVFDFVVAVNK
ncbi:1392_t:CDS:2, partial [Dentiscutata heterogama]